MKDEHFGQAVELTLDFEGEGGAHDPDDPGGFTRWGIAQRWHPDIDVENLTRADAVDLLWSDYWRPLFCERMPWPLSAAMFDHGVHSGPGAAAKSLQRALRVTADGIVGRRTLAALASHVAPPRGQHILLLGQFRRRIAELKAEPHAPKYLAGWMYRIVELGCICGVELGRQGFDYWAEDSPAEPPSGPPA